MDINNKPTSVIIGGITIPIRVVEEFSDQRLGEYDGEKREISVTRRCYEDPTLFNWVIVHEMVHCALDISGANYGMSTKTEEQVVSAVEALLVPAVRLFDVYHL